MIANKHSTEVPISTSNSSRIKSFYYFLHNFEIWGSFNNSFFKGLVERRQTALLSLIRLTNYLVYEIKEFKNKHQNYDKYVSEVLWNIFKILIYFDLVKTLLLKKKDFNSIDHSDKNIKNYSSLVSNNFQKEKNSSIGKDFNQVEKIIKLNMSNIQEEDKESSYNLMSLNHKEEVFVKRRRSSNSVRKIEEIKESISLCRNPTASIFSNDTINDIQLEASRSKN